ncbi:PAS domain-containing hybrid sensor histidine kinase/response regulator [Planctopirus hydrillae]|uniref:PAS domain-containing hybrid sensor histidine kinase/response regulator n=1 Tax=Planctopirus hydrillae TaxID=1841610 RepID=UPI001042820E|nr:ATP-binding protein [Planctopirus hydrillae]
MSPISPDYPQVLRRARDPLWIAGAVALLFLGLIFWDQSYSLDSQRDSLRPSSSVNPGISQTLAARPKFIQTAHLASAHEMCPLPASAFGVAASALSPVNRLDYAPSRTGAPIVDFFTGGGYYMPRTHCLLTSEGTSDWPWIIALLMLNAAVIVAYLRIFIFWMRSYFDERAEDRNQQLFDLAAIFLFCAICGYAMSMLMFVWPAYRLLAFFLLALNIFSWRFCTNLASFGKIFASKRLERQLRETVESRAVELERQVRNRTSEVNRLAEIARRTANGVVITDRKGRVEWINEGFTRICGYTIEDLRGKKPGDVLQGPHTNPEVIQRIGDAIRQGLPVTEEVVNYSKSGREYYIRIEIDPLRDERGEISGFMAIESDITEQHQHQEELKRHAEEMVRLRNAAESANRAKTDFLANMSHEIRTPMTAILGFTELLAENSDSAGTTSAERVECIETIRRNGDHLLAIINDILDLSKIEAGMMTVEKIPTDLVHLLKDVESLMQFKATRKGINLRLNLVEPLPTIIHTDPVRLKQILVNLLGNAIKFTEHGEVSIKVHTDANPFPGLIVIDVVDTGIGMTSQQMSQLFGAFVQADTSTTRKFGGTGLGLRISKSLAQLLGGNITINSEPGKGSVFQLTISTGLAKAPQEVVTDNKPESATQRLVKEEAAVEIVKQLPLSGLNIALVEDGLDNQRLIAFHLRKAGADVAVFDNGKLALEAMTSDGTIQGSLGNVGLFDLIVTDMQMPEMDGYTFARSLRTKGFTHPIIALTAHAMEWDKKRCLDSGCDYYISKPVDRAALIDTCRNAVAASVNTN